MFALPLFVRRALIVAWDIVSWLAALAAFLLVRYDLSLTDRQWGNVLAFVGCAIVLQVAGGFAFHLYLGRSRVGSFAEATTLSLLVILVLGILDAVFFLIVEYFPRGIAFGLPALALLLMMAGRWTFRNIYDANRKRRTGVPAERALVYGAGDAGHEVVRQLMTSPDAPYELVGLIDDDPGKRFLRVQGNRVLGTGVDLVDVARRHEVAAVILAVSQASARMIQRLSDECSEAGLTLVVIPPTREWLGGRPSLTQLRAVNVDDLLGRRQIKTNVSEIAGYLTGQVVLVTGAGGSIGAELAAQVRRLGPKKLVLLDRDETGLHGVQLALYGKGLLDTDDMVLCDIRDAAALDTVFAKHQPSVVFHAAALKHLPMLEQYPLEGWKTNVVGTLNVLRAARAHGVGTFVNISTDKAAEASSVLGRTKRVAERATAWYARRYGLRYLSVRFGNVLGSRGSVLHTFNSQIERGGPVTITHPEVTRYFMTIPEACELVLQAGAMGRPGDVLVLDMGEPVRIVDVARQLIQQSGRAIAIEYTGLRHGEKLHEVLSSSGEHPVPSEHPLISQVDVPGMSPADILGVDAGVPSAVDEFLETSCQESFEPAPPTTTPHLRIAKRGVRSVS